MCACIDIFYVHKSVSTLYLCRAVCSKRPLTSSVSRPSTKSNMVCRFSPVCLFVISLVIAGASASVLKDRQADVVIALDVYYYYNNYGPSPTFKTNRKALLIEVFRGLDYTRIGKQMQVAFCITTNQVLFGRFVGNGGFPKDKVDNLLEEFKNELNDLDDAKYDPPQMDFNLSRMRNPADFWNHFSTVRDTSKNWQGARPGAPHLFIWITSGDSSTQGIEGKTKAIFDAMKGNVDEVIYFGNRQDSQKRVYQANFYNGGRDMAIDEPFDDTSNQIKIYELINQTLMSNLAKCDGAKQNVDESGCELQSKTSCVKTIKYSPSQSVPTEDHRFCSKGEETVGCAVGIDGGSNICKDVLCFMLDRKDGACNAECGEIGDQEVSYVTTEKWHEDCPLPPIRKCYGPPCPFGEIQNKTQKPTEMPAEPIKPWQIAVVALGGTAVLGILAIIITVIVVFYCRGNTKDVGRKHIHPPWYSRYRSKDRRGQGTDNTRQGPSVGPSQRGTDLRRPQSQSQGRTDQRYNRPSPSQGGRR